MAKLIVNRLYTNTSIKPCATDESLEKVFSFECEKVRGIHLLAVWILCNCKEM